MRRKKRRQIRACPRYNICCDLVSPDRSKINRISCTGSGEKCGPDSAFGASLSLLAFRGLQQHERRFILLNIDSLAKQLAAARSTLDHVQGFNAT